MNILQQTSRVTIMNKWIVVIVPLLAVFIGLKFIFSSAVILVFLIVSFVVGFFYETNSLVSRGFFDIFIPLEPVFCVPNNVNFLSTGNPKFCLDKRLSGSSIIDDALQDLFQYIIRDYIENWYSMITQETSFLFESKQVLQKIAINASNRCKEVDWLPFLTTRFVDSVIGHIRLYRETKTKLKTKFFNNEDPKIMNQNLLNTFFELELSTSLKKICRKKISMNPEFEKESLKTISDFFLQLLGSKEELNSRPIQLLSSQILTGEIIIPLLDFLADPDNLNQQIIWLCKNGQITSESFLTVLRSTENIGELEATRELLTREIAIMRSHDFGGEDDIFIKRRLSSLLFVNRLIDNHIQELNDDGRDHDSGGASIQSYWNQYLVNHHIVYQLPLDVILKNSVALSYLLDFMAMIGSQAYIFFLLNVEGWEIAANQQISQLKLEGLHIKTEYNNYLKQSSVLELNHPGQILMSLQEAAVSIFNQYFSDNSNPRLHIDDVIIRRLLYNLKNEPPTESWFDEAKSAVICKIEKDDRFMSSFRKSIGYIRLLAELDLLKDASKSDDEDVRSLDDQSTSDSTVLLPCAVEEKEKERFGNESSSSISTTDESATSYSLTASICQKGVVKDGITSHAVYAVTVVKSIGCKEIDSWVVYRRYSDFYDFHVRLEEKFKAIRELTFPAKRAFNNMDKLFLERRQFLLNDYLTKLLKPESLRMNSGLRESLLQFFDRGSYEHSKGIISRKVDSLMNPLVSSMRTVTKVVRLESGGLKESGNNEESLDVQTLSGIPLYGDDKLPLKILLILMDEVFDLHTRNQWLRKRVFYMLREILRAMFGDVFNQKIVDYVLTATAPQQVAELIHVIKNSCWPNGVPAMPRPQRDEATRMRTRVAAKMSLLSWFSDEIKHLIGSETTREGVLRIFELLQNPILNRRLLYVIFEGVADTLFPDSNIDELFEKLHSDNSN